ncbi:MAG: hypothetical protein WD960_03650 [Gemmatimonadota bacterium]
MGPFTFSDRGLPLTMDERIARMTDHELQERSRQLSLRLQESWRAGKRNAHAVLLLARAAKHPPVAERLTEQERRELAVDR